MITDAFNLRFDFLVEAARVSLLLEADVQEHHSDTYYTVTNFRIAEKGTRSILPDIKIRKDRGQWVHLDSGQPTDLSTAVGRAIDARAGAAPGDIVSA